MYKTENTGIKTHQAKNPVPYGKMWKYLKQNHGDQRLVGPMLKDKIHILSKLMNEIEKEFV